MEEHRVIQQKHARLWSKRYNPWLIQDCWHLKKDNLMLNKILYQDMKAPQHEEHHGFVNIEKYYAFHIVLDCWITFHIVMNTLISCIMSSFMNFKAGEIFKISSTTSPKRVSKKWQIKKNTKSKGEGSMLWVSCFSC